MSTRQPTTTPSTATQRPGKMASTQSLNHLLNFSLPPRQHQPVPRRSRKYGTQHGVWNKERFVNAQYRFVMNPTGDYTVHFADPDIYFQWGDILQVIIPRQSALASTGTISAEASNDEGLTSCPICLSPPVAPRMTKCGHVFCFPCVLHLINTADNKWVRCPICFDSINERQLKPVKWYEYVPQDDDEIDHAPEASSSSSAMGLDPSGAPRPGSTMQMRLMQRPTITTLSLPRSDTWPSDLLPPHQAPWHFAPDVYAFSKFMLATPTYLLDELSKELDQLAAERRSLAGMKDELGVLFVDSADQRVRSQMEWAASMENAYLKSSVEKAAKDQADLLQRMARLHVSENTTISDAGTGDAPEAFLASQQTGFKPQAAIPTTAPQNASPARNPRQRRNINPPPPSTSTYYYYQAASGLPIFLHPLDIRVLHSHFDDYAAFPNRITVRVEAATASTVNDDLRKRCKYLGHMPEGADVVFVEADLVDVVGQQGVQAFDGALKSRRARRKDKDRKDNNARARAEEKERERREEELNRSQWTPSTWNSSHHLVSAPQFEVPQLDEFPIADAGAEAEAGVVGATASPVTGAWGARTFASAANRAPTGMTRARTQPQVQEEEWDFDGAWDDLEQSIASSGGRKRRGSRMVVLGGGGGRRR